MKKDRLMVVFYVEKLKQIYEFRKYLTLWEQSFIMSLLNKKKYIVEEPTSRTFRQQYVLVTFNQSCVVSNIMTSINEKIHHE